LAVVDSWSDVNDRIQAACLPLLAPAVPKGAAPRLGFCSPPHLATAPATSSEVLGVTDRDFLGQIVSFSPENGFGFISCPELHDIYSKDTFLHKSQLGSCHVSDTVKFRVFLNKDGMPQAKELDLTSRGTQMKLLTVPAIPNIQSHVAPPSSMALPAVPDQRFYGAISRFNHEKGFGFISCPEMKKHYPKDVFLHKEQIGLFTPGSNVSFAVFYNKDGMPQAKDLAQDGSPDRGQVPLPVVGRQLPLPVLGRQNPLPVVGLPSTAPRTSIEVAGVTDRRFQGAILRYSHDTGYGFIACPEIKALYDKDVFVHKEQIGAFAVGNNVTFGVFLNKQGNPQSKDLADAASHAGYTDRRVSRRIG